MAVIDVRYVVREVVSGWGEAPMVETVGTFATLEEAMVKISEWFNCMAGALLISEVTCETGAQS